MIVGFCGGTGSGKTTIARRVVESVGEDRVVYLPQDHYYRDLDHLPIQDRSRINFDHPDSFDNELLIHHLERLGSGKPVEQPVYDFTVHSRRPETRRVEPKPVILLEGILIFEDPRLRALMDLKVFVDTADDIRFIRRLQRDIEERGRTVQAVIDQYLTTVRPMHLEFVEANKRYADVIIPEGGFNSAGIDVIIEKVRSRLASA